MHIDVYIETGRQRTFAGAIDWPGWCRSGLWVESALQALLEYGPRYARVLRGTGLAFTVPTDRAAFAVVERLQGTSTTDFGAPAVAPSNDAASLDDAALQRSRALLEACWRAFDASAEAVRGKALRKGPRGGGREPEDIVRHVVDGDKGYLQRLAWKLDKADASHPNEELVRTRLAILDALESSARGEVAERGPRGGVRWTPRYFVRRVAWHVLDHAWEIEDRAS